MSKHKKSVNQLAQEIGLAGNKVIMEVKEYQTIMDRRIDKNLNKIDRLLRNKEDTLYGK